MAKKWWYENRSITPKEYHTKCCFCKKDMVIFYLGKKYCSDNCRQKKYNIPKEIEKAKLQITKQLSKIKRLENLL
jgi:hypothetical protein